MAIRLLMSVNVVGCAFTLHLDGDEAVTVEGFLGSVDVEMQHAIETGSRSRSRRVAMSFYVDDRDADALELAVGRINAWLNR